MDITKIYHGRDRMNLTCELDLCEDENILSNKDNLLNIGKLLRVEAKTYNEMPNKNWDMADSEMEGRKLMRDKQIFKAFSDKIACLICPDNPTFHENNDVKGIKVYQSLKENLIILAFWGRK